MRHLGPRSFGRAVAVSTATVVLCGMTLGYAGVASASSNLPKPVNGVTPASSITVWTAAAPDEAPQQPQLAAFTKATGIKVTYDAFPKASCRTRSRPLKRSSRPTLTCTRSPRASRPAMSLCTAWLRSTAYIKNKTLTPASYNFAGLPPGSYAQCTLGKTQYCLPVDTDPGPSCSTTSGCSRPPA